jgi:hypothetical protein
MILIIVSFYWIYIYVKLVDRRKVLLFFGVVTVGSYFILASMNGFIYRSSPEWDAVIKLIQANFYLLSFSLFMDYERDVKVFESVGWTFDDYSMYLLWFYADKAVYSVDSIRNLTNGIMQNVLQSMTPDRILAYVKNSFSGFAAMPLFLVTSYFLIIISSILNKYKLLLFCVFPSIVVLVVFTILGRAPDRILLPVYLTLILLVVLMCHLNGVSRVILSSFEKSYIHVLEILLVLFVVLSTIIFLFHNYDNRKSELFAQEYYKKFPSGKDDLTIVFPTLLPLSVHSFDSNKHYRPGSILMSSWTTQSPIHEEILKRQGIDDVYQAIIHRPNTYVMSRPEHRVYLENVLKSRHGSNKEFVVVDTHGTIELATMNP